MRPYLITGLALLAAIAAVAGLWFGAAWLQEWRADSILRDANSHIVNANQTTAEMHLEQLGRESAASVERMNQAAAAAGALPALLDSAGADVDAAAAGTGSGAGMPLLAEWYGEYLGRKHDTASLRSQQIALLKEMDSQLIRFYAAGPAVFDSLQDIDRLHGQLADSLSRVQSDPRGAAANLRNISQGYTAIGQQLDQVEAQTGFELLPQLAQVAADNAGLAALGAQLAEAAGAGDQARAQQIAGGLDQKQAVTGIGEGAIDNWWSARIEPLQSQYADLQTRQEALDGEAASLYSSHR